MERERETMKVMVEIYCKDHHHPFETPCKECQEFLDFALFRLTQCPFQEKKPACQNCQIHCYRSNQEMRRKAKQVMGYAGPRMLMKHPYFSLMHVIDKFRKTPNLKEIKKVRKQ